MISVFFYFTLDVSPPWVQVPVLKAVELVRTASVNNTGKIVTFKDLNLRHQNLQIKPTILSRFFKFPNIK